MVHVLTLPKLGLTMESAKIVEWRKAEGDWIEKKQIVYVLETEKLTYEVEADGAGFLHILVGLEIEVPVAAKVGYLAATKEEYQEIAHQKLEKAPPEGAQTGPAITPSQPAPSAQTPAPSPSRERIKISPVARKIAEEKGINLQTIRGTGPGGMIQKEDVLKAVEEKQKLPEAPPSPKVEVIHGKRIKEKTPLTGMRKAISDRMHLSLQQMAQMTAFGKVDMSETVKFREKLLAQEEKLGIRVTFTDIFVKVLSMILKEMPLFNASIEEKQIVFWEDINIGVAVALENGLIVPVIHGVGEKTIVEIAKKRQELVDKARSKSLLPDDVAGGTFTLSNFGSYGGDTETAIINPPEVALMGVGKITDEAVVINGQIVVRPMMNFSFTTDHRLIDGATSGNFRARFREILENPVILLTALR